MRDLHMHSYKNESLEVVVYVLRRRQWFGWNEESCKPEQKQTQECAYRNLKWSFLFTVSVTHQNTVCIPGV